MSILRPLHFILFFALSLEAQARFSCVNLFAVFKSSKPAVSQIESKSDYESFVDLKQSMISQIKSNQNIKDNVWSEPQSKIAFLQAVGEVSNWDILNIDSLVSQGESKMLKKVSRIVNKMDFEQGVGKYQFRNQLTQLYTLLNPAPYSLFRSPHKNIEKTIEQKIEKAFLENSMEKAVADLGLLKTGRDISKFKEFRHKHRKYERAVLSMFLNVVTMDVIGGTSDMAALLKRNKQIPEELIQKIYDQGIDSAREDISSYLRKNARRGVRWNYVRSSVQTFTYGVVLYYLTSIYPYVKIGYEAMTTTPEKLEQVQRESFNAEEIKKEMIKDWKEAFYELEGHYPDMKNPREKAEFETAQRDINNLKDKDLTVDFKEIK